MPFSNYLLAQTLGIIALILILHAGGLGTTLDDVRAVRSSALVLSTDRRRHRDRPRRPVRDRFLHLGWLHGLLLGAAVSSTDVAAVFTVLRSRNVSLAGPHSPAARARVGAERSDDGLPERRPAAADPRAGERVAAPARADVLPADHPRDGDRHRRRQADALGDQLDQAGVRRALPGAQRRARRADLRRDAKRRRQRLSRGLRVGHRPRQPDLRPQAQPERCSTTASPG